MLFAMNRWHENRLSYLKLRAFYRKACSQRGKWRTKVAHDHKDFGWPRLMKDRHIDTDRLDTGGGTLQPSREHSSWFLDCGVCSLALASHGS